MHIYGCATVICTITKRDGKRYWKRKEKNSFPFVMMKTQIHRVGDNIDHWILIMTISG
jgi:hypothetical protein